MTFLFRQPSKKNKNAVEPKAQKVLELRGEFPDNIPADLN